MDSVLVWLVQRLLGKGGVIRIFLSFIARFGYFLYIIYGLVEWVRPGRDRLKRRHSLLYTLFSVIIGSVTSHLIGWLWFRPRPFARHREIDNLIPHQANASFPSNHSALSFAIGLHLLSGKCRHGAALFCMSLLIGLSRIYTGVHYVSDVLGGFLLGTASYFAVKDRAWPVGLADWLCRRWGIWEVSWTRGKKK